MWVGRLSIGRLASTGTFMEMQSLAVVMQLLLSPILGPYHGGAAT